MTRTHFHSFIWDQLLTHTHTNASVGGLTYGQLLSVVRQAVPRLHQLIQKSSRQANGDSSTPSPPSSSTEQPSHHQVPLAGLLGDQGLHFVAMMLTCLAAGCAFLPMDPNWPDSHVQEVVRAAQPDCVVVIPSSSSSSSIDSTSLTGLTSVITAGSAQILGDIDTLSQMTVRDPGSVEQQTVLQPSHQQHNQKQVIFPPLQQPQQQSQPSRSAALPYFCVMYTSGSTGKPAGVCCTEEGLLNRCHWMQQHSPLLATDIVAVKTSPCFVDSLWEVFGPLLAGASMLLLPRSTVLQPLQMAQALIQGRVTHFVAVPTVLRLMLPGLKAPGCCLKQVVSSGEPLSLDLCQALREVLPQSCRLLNLYGSTEVAADCTCFDTQHLQPFMQQLSSHSHRRADNDNGDKEQEQRERAVPQEQQSQQQQQHDAILSSVPAGSPIFNTVVLISQVPDSSTLPLSTSPSLQGGSAAQVCPLPPNTTGEVLVAGAGVAAGYLGSLCLNHLDSPCLNQPAQSGLLSPRQHAEQQQQRQNQTQQNQTQQQHQQRFPLLWLCDDHLPFVSMGKQTTSHPQTLPAATHPPHSEHQAAAAKHTKPAPLHPSLTGLCDSREGTRFFRTGDLGYLTEDGQGGLLLVVTGRCDHQVKVSGVRVDLLTVEAALQTHPQVQQAAVVANAQLTTHSLGSTLVAFVLPLPHPHTTSEPPHSSISSLNSSSLSLLPSAPTTAPLNIQDRPPSSHERYDLTTAPHTTQDRPPSSHEHHNFHALQLQLRSFLAARLPTRAHVPLHFVRLNHPLPCSAAGKVQRPVELAREYLQQQQVLSHQNQQQQLQAHSQQQEMQPQSSEQQATTSSAPLTESHIMSVFVSVLGGERACRLEPMDDFFAAGGTSMQAAEVAGTLGIEMRLLLAAPTVRQLTALLRSEAQRQEGDLLSAPPPAKRMKGTHNDSGEIEHKSTITTTAEGAASLTPPQGPPPAQSLSFPPPCTTHLPLSTLASHLAHATHAVVTTPQGTHTHPHIVLAPTHPLSEPQQQQQPQASLNRHEHQHNKQQQQQDQPPPFTSRHSNENTACCAVAWRRRMGRCIDAAPVLVTLFCAGSGEGSACEQQGFERMKTEQQQQQQQQSEQQGHQTMRTEQLHGREDQPQPIYQQQQRQVLGEYVLACSHDGDVGCFEASSGACVWHKQLPARAEAGLVVSQGLRHVMVACADGLRCLCLATGEPATPGEAGANLSEGVASASEEPTATTESHDGVVVSLGGEPKAVPVLDLWGTGCVWVTSHGRQLVVVQPPGRVLARLPLQAASSVPPVFSTSHRHLVLVACLDGSVQAWHVSLPHHSSTQLHSACVVQEATNTDVLQQQHTPVIELSHAWMATPSQRSPIFSTPAVAEAAGVVVVAHVDGNIKALSLQDGHMVWSRDLSCGLVFAPLRLCPLLDRPATVSGVHIQWQGADTNDVHGLQSQQQGVLVATHEGLVQLLCCGSGQTQWRVQVGGSTNPADLRVSAAPVWLLIQAHDRVRSEVREGSEERGQHNGDLMVCIFSSSGLLTLVRVCCSKQEGERIKDERGGEGTAVVVGCFRLPSEVFSSPVLRSLHSESACLFVGCRDDQLYRLDITRV